MTGLVDKAKFYLVVKAIELRSIWRNAVGVYKMATDGKGYPWSLKEIWNSQVGLTCTLLRNSVEDLVQDYPHIPSKYIRGLLSTPMTFQYLGGKTPFNAVVDDPAARTMGNAKIAIRREVYDLDNMMRENPNTDLSRSFFAPQLRK
ncbi:MAG TPA: hypothetical protein DCM27_07200 [Rhodospirillaceae bacterium]|nr:hypothetical protein [Rhodospirillaceae bacterium]